MFDNIGGKIKTVVKTTCIVEIISCVITGVVLLVNEQTWQGFSVMFGGSILAWISSFYMYGFGQLVENSDIIAKQCGRQNEKHEKYVQKKKETEVKAHTQKAKVKIKDDNVDDEAFIDITCPHCKEMLSFKKRLIVEEKLIECPFCEKTIDFS